MTAFGAMLQEGEASNVVLGLATQLLNLRGLRVHSMVAGLIVRRELGRGFKVSTIVARVGGGVASARYLRAA